MDATNIIPPHEVRDSAKLDALVASMTANGWQGRPLLVAETVHGVRALTGSHRTAAACIAGIDVPVVVLSADAWAAVLEQDASIDETRGLSHDQVLSACRWAYQDAAEGSVIEAEIDAAIEQLEAEEEANLND